MDTSMIIAMAFGMESPIVGLFHHGPDDIPRAFIQVFDSPKCVLFPSDPSDSPRRFLFSQAVPYSIYDISLICLIRRFPSSNTIMWDTPPAGP